MEDDAVNPKHYSDFGQYAGIHIIRAWTKIRRGMGKSAVSFNIGQAVKYIQRAGIKTEDETDDIGKAIWYLQSELHEINPNKFPDPAAQE